MEQAKKDARLELEASRKAAAEAVAEEQNKARSAEDAEQQAAAMLAKAQEQTNSRQAEEGRMKDWSTGRRYGKAGSGGEGGS